mgnify:CR=1 FL=1
MKKYLKKALYSVLTIVGLIASILIAIILYALICARLYLTYPCTLVHRIQRFLISAFKANKNLMYACSVSKRKDAIINAPKLLHPAIDTGQTEVHLFLDQKLTYFLNPRNIQEKIAIPYHECIYVIGFCQIFKFRDHGFRSKS